MHCKRQAPGSLPFFFAPGPFFFLDVRSAKSGRTGWSRSFAFEKPLKPFFFEKKEPRVFFGNPLKLFIFALSTWI